MSGGARVERRIADYALIGDCETAALVHRSGVIEWLCWPRFDSPACFAALVGSPENGRWRIGAVDEDARLSRRYRGHSLILETCIETATGTALLIDFMPVRRQASDVVRIVHGQSGTVRLQSELTLRFDHGRIWPRWTQEKDGLAVAVAGPNAARLAAERPLRLRDDRACIADFTISAGERAAFVLTYCASHGASPDPVDAELALAETEHFWADWVARCRYEGPWRDAVIRSLITMKALTYRPSGGIVAAPTTSLSEESGKSGNWDYRFCWLRDATFALLSLLHSGYREEAAAWRDWLLRAAGGDPAQLQPIYGMAGESLLPEWEADWLSGFQGVKPVRLGNAAFAQRQFDVCGEVVDALHQARAHGIAPSDLAWRLQLRMVEHLESVWQQPDSGIWEARGHRRRFTHSQAMIWAAVDRMIRHGEAEHPEAPLARWREWRARIHHEICHRGYNSELNSFVRCFDAATVDASLLLLPQIGFLPPEDPRIRGTVAAIGDRLCRDGFVFRHEADDDGESRPAGAAAFLACSFWYADALLMLGRREEAVAIFERALSVRNDLGLLSEEYEIGSGRLTGNFPQALSHLALVNTALNLARSEGPARRRSQLGPEPADEARV